MRTTLLACCAWALILAGACTCSSSSAPDAGAADGARDVSRVDAPADVAIADARVSGDAVGDIDESRCLGDKPALPPIARDAPIVGRRGLAWDTLLSEKPLHPWHPALFGDRIVLTVNRLGVVAADRSGKLLWVRPIEPSEGYAFGDEIYPLGQTAAYATGSGSLRLLNLQGQQVWRQDGLGPFITDGTLSNIQATVRLSDGSTVVLTSAGRLTRVSPTGAIRWSRKLSGYGITLLRMPNDQIIVGGTRVALYTSRGLPLWETRPLAGPEHGSAYSLVPTSRGQVLLTWLEWTSQSRKLTSHLFTLDPSCGRSRLILSLPDTVHQMLVDDQDHLVVRYMKRVVRYRPDATIAWTYEPKSPMVLESILLGSDGTIFATATFTDSTHTGAILQGDLETGKLKTIYQRDDVQLRPHPVLLDGGLLVIGAVGSAIPPGKSRLIGLRVSSTRLMQRGWPRLGGGNDNAFAFR